MDSNKIGRYQVLRELGRGGMATVYVAYDPYFEREVAVKTLPLYFAHEVGFQERFEREAKTIASLEHHAIVPVYDYGRVDDQPYLVMRYMRGGTLATRLTDGPISVPEIIPILRRVAEALDKAHAKGIVHRDLKPENILFDENGQSYLSDFGIVKLMESSTAFTQTGGAVGTPAYMSPEQAKGQRDIDGRSDVYALGVVLYEMLTGKAPFQSDTPFGVAMKHVLEPIPDIRSENPTLPAGCDAVIRRAMAKLREQRYKTALDMITALHLALTDQPTARPLVADSDQTIVEPPAAREKAKATPISSQAVPTAVQAAGGSPPPVRAAAVTPRPAPKPFPRSWLMGGAAVLGLILLVSLYLIFGNNGATADQPTNELAQGAEVDETGAAQATEAALALVATADANATTVAAALSAQATSETLAAEATASAGATATVLAIPTETPVPTATAVGGGGEIIAFDSDRDGTRDLYFMNVDGTNPFRFFDSLDNEGDPVWSPDLTRLSFESRSDGDPEVYTILIDGSGLTQLTNNTTRDWAAVWSPDGQKIAFASDRDGLFEIYVMDADGGNQTRLTNNNVVDTFPSWSPDGRKLVFESVTGQDIRNLMVINSDGTGLAQLTNDSTLNQHPAWSPDGQKIAFTSKRDGNLEIYIINADGSNPVRLTNDPANDAHAAWAPDGTMLAFDSDRDGNFEIYRMNLDGSGLTNLTNHPANDVFPEWKP